MIQEFKDFIFDRGYASYFDELYDELYYAAATSFTEAVSYDLEQTPGEWLLNDADSAQEEWKAHYEALVADYLNYLMCEASEIPWIEALADDFTGWYELRYGEPLDRHVVFELVYDYLTLLRKYKWEYPV